MKTKLIATILLSVIGLMLVLGGTTHAQSLDNHRPIQQQTISNTVYLPFVLKPECTYVRWPEFYASVSKPVVRVGEIITFTGALVNDCTPIGHPFYSMYTWQVGVLSPSLIQHYGSPTTVFYGSYQEMTFTVPAVGAGVVTVTMGANYETQHPDNPYMWYLEGVGTDVVMRILP